MKHIKNITWILAAVFTAGLLSLQAALAQSIDEERMNRDIKVAEKVLAELFRSTKDSRSLYTVQETSSIRGTYIPGYGVLFRVPQLFYTNISDGVVYVNSDGKKRVMQDRVIVSNIGQYKSGQTVYWLDKQAMLLEPVVLRGRVQKRKKVRGISIDSVINGRREKALGLIKSFLGDYSSLLSQLSGNDKIVVTYDRVLNMERLFRRRPEMNDKNSFAVSVAYKDVKNSQGKNLGKKMTVAPLTIEQKDRMQFNVFKRILDELFERRNTDRKSFYRSGRSSYTYLKNFGVIYDIRLRKPRKNRKHVGYYVNGEGTVIVNGGVIKKDDNRLTGKERREKRDKERTEYKKIVENAYVKLEKDLKKHMVDYGRTLRSLGPNQVLMFNVRLSSSHYYYDDYYENDKKATKIPRLLVLTVKMSDLDSNNAESKVKIKKY